MTLATVTAINTVRSKKDHKETSKGLSFCPQKREQQYDKLSQDDHEELYKILTGKYDKGDED